ncbi:MAG: hypothetical protein WC471_01315 [Candidatus Woesearchaeota archaeon]
MRKAQISVDFLIVLSIALIMFMFLFKTASDRTQQFDIEASRVYAKELNDRLAQQVKSVYYAGDGSVLHVDLPVTLMNNLDYSINFYPAYYLVEINYTAGTIDSRYSAFVPTSLVSGNLVNIHQPITIRNVNGAIVIS